MEIRPEVMERLLSADDERLWETVRRVAIMNNISLPATPPSAADMEKIRAGLKGGMFSYDEAMRILTSYKKGEKR
ncbi:MAG: hypothetical protein E7609_00555 [Ruminococcaceae bacterium]|nr:hypothetical protein [Oscillospiraceae bacterium]